jgi:hypothetical protein
MAYIIFLKYLRSLEEFRKNPHVKIPPKSPCANFQSLGIFKNSIFIRKGIFLRFRPIWPSPARAGPLHPAGRRIPAPPIRPKQLWRICRKAYSLRLCALLRRCLLSLTSLPCGARPSASSPSPRRSTVASSPHRLRPPCATRPPTSRCRARSSLPALIPPFNSPLNLSSHRPTINGIKAITVSRFPLPRPGVPLPGHYKRERSTPSHHHTHPRPPLLAFESATPTLPSTDRRRRFPPLLDHLVTARAPVRPTVSFPCSPLSVVPPPVTFRAPEWPKAMLR